MRHKQKAPLFKMEGRRSLVKLPFALSQAEVDSQAKKQVVAKWWKKREECTQPTHYISVWKANWPIVASLQESKSQGERNRADETTLQEKVTTQLMAMYILKKGGQALASVLCLQACHSSTDYGIRHTKGMKLKLGTQTFVVCYMQCFVTLIKHALCSIPCVALQFLRVSSKFDEFYFLIRQGRTRLYACAFWLAAPKEMLQTLQEVKLRSKNSFIPQPPFDLTIKASTVNH